MPTHDWCDALLGRAATQLRGDLPFEIDGAGPDLVVSYLWHQVGLELPTGRILSIRRQPRPSFGGVGPPLPPRAVIAHDFVYGTLGSTSAELSLEDMQAFLGLLPNGLQEASILWSGQGAGCARFNPAVAAFLQGQAATLRRINFAAREGSS